MDIVKEIGRVVFGIRRYINFRMSKFAKGIKNKKILEIGSGETDFFSAKQYFDKSNDFQQSDINESYGRVKLDVTTMDFKEQWDIVLCLSVLEHVFDYEKAIENCYNAVKKGGTVIFFTPFCYPLHQEPGDYWRFTEHALRKLLHKFEIIEIKHIGFSVFPSSYYVECKRN